jgi:hypothetical protein
MTQLFRDTTLIHHTPRHTVVALAISLSLLLSGCVTVTPPEPSTTSTPTYEDVPQQLEEFYGQVLTWQNCGKELQCSTASAPQDWEHPETGAIDLALIRHPAKNGKPIGSLLINPGGPGGSGYSFVADSLDVATTPRLQENFDIVGFDPRGVGVVLTDVVYSVS